MTAPSAAAARPGTAGGLVILFHKNVPRVLFPDRQMITTDRKFHGVSERRAPPYPHPRALDQPEFLQPVMQILGPGISPDDSAFAGKKAVQCHDFHKFKDPW
jgi:hypothetical protein